MCKAGFLEVGHNEKGEVVVNLDHDRTGHIIFSPDQARNLARLMKRRADFIDGLVSLDEPAEEVEVDESSEALFAELRQLWNDPAAVDPDEKNEAYRRAFLEGRALELTRGMGDHPEGWDAACYCNECRSC